MYDPLIQVGMEVFLSQIRGMPENDEYSSSRYEAQPQ